MIDLPSGSHFDPPLWIQRRLHIKLQLIKAYQLQSQASAQREEEILQQQKQQNQNDCRFNVDVKVNVKGSNNEDGGGDGNGNGNRNVVGNSDGHDNGDCNGNVVANGDGYGNDNGVHYLTPTPIPPFVFPYSVLLDIGCGEGRVMDYFANDGAVQWLAGVDRSSHNIDKAVQTLRPPKNKYEWRAQREAPLNVAIWCMDITQTFHQHDQYDYQDNHSRDGDEMDSGAGNGSWPAFQCGVCSEVIEHIPPQHLDAFAVFLFSTLRLPVVVLTTPNAEYNVHFPNLNYGMPHASFRDDDHKFEWTRLEFQQWCTTMAKRFHYKVSFDGVGLGKDVTYDPQIGLCTQSATFICDSHRETHINTRHGDKYSEADIQTSDKTNRISSPGNTSYANNHGDSDTYTPNNRSGLDHGSHGTTQTHSPTPVRPFKFPSQSLVVRFSFPGFERPQDRLPAPKEEIRTWVLDHVLPDLIKYCPQHVQIHYEAQQQTRENSTNDISASDQIQNKETVSNQNHDSLPPTTNLVRVQVSLSAVWDNYPLRKLCRGQWTALAQAISDLFLTIPGQSQSPCLSVTIDAAQFNHWKNHSLKRPRSKSVSPLRSRSLSSSSVHSRSRSRSFSSLRSQSSSRSHVASSPSSLPDPSVLSPRS